MGVLVGVLIVSTLAACSGDHSTADATSSRSAGSSVTLPTPEASTSTGAGPSASGTGSGFDVLANMPAAAKAHTNAGAQAFARYYVEAYGRLLMDPAKGQLTKLYLPQCTECPGQETNLADTVDRAIRWKDLFYRTVHVTEPEVNGESVNASSVLAISLSSLLTTVPVAVQVGSAPATTRPKGQDVWVRFRLSWQAERWYVADFQSQSTSSSTP